jgi:hypothetical protein
MTIVNTITKKLLENIVHETFLKFGSVSCSSLLDSLKLLGFSYATFAGISINIEDLKTPNSKKTFISQANIEISEISNFWKQGELSDTERFQAIIDSWNVATESLKNRIIDYYQNYDPTNNLYIMAFSGARGNMSQVRQLVGMRGLMSDQEGKIIDLPIQTNFREGLSSIDYIISSYGARKGIVDTALKTADSGYLTRRLIYVAQDLVIRQKNCGTKDGVIFLLEKTTNIKNLIGRYLISIKDLKNFQIISNFENKLLDEESFSDLKKFAPLILNIRSSLTCKSNGSICQNCYGWDLAHGKIIALGEAVGIIAAQSIGEPGTQLTMRTFHTGGIFTGELVSQIVSPFSGKIIFSPSLKLVPYRTSHGVLVSKLQQETSLFIINWEGKTKEIFLDIGAFLYAPLFSFVKKGQLIAEFMTQNILPSGRKLKPIFSSFSGEIRFENLLVRKIFREKRTIKVNQDDGILWITSGKLFTLPKEANTFFPEIFMKNYPFSFIKFVSPFEGVIKISKENLILLNKNQKYYLNLKKLKIITKGFFSKLSLFVKNYQYIDSYTILGNLYFFPQYQGNIYLIRKKNSKYQSIFFIITDEEIWKINCDQVNDYPFLQEKKGILRAGSFLTLNSITKNPGIFIKKDGLKLIFQMASPIFLRKGAILNYKQGDFITPNKVVANLVNYIQQTEDIVQGLPKIEELVEARKPKIKSYLALRPGILLNSTLVSENQTSFLKKYSRENIIECIYEEDILSSTDLKKKRKKQNVSIIHSFFVKDPLTIFQNQIYRASRIPFIFKSSQKIFSKNEGFLFQNFKKEIFLPFIKPSISSPSWIRKKIENYDNSKNGKYYLFQFFNNQLHEWLQIESNSIVLKNKNEDLIIFTEKKGPIFLEYLNPIVKYKLPLSSKVIFPPGNFLDIGEPFTEGIIDIHELLHILFKYHSTLDNLMSGSLKGLHKFQLLLVNSIQSIYQSQGINISSKHIEIIVRQMTNKVVITESGDTPFLPGELIRLSLIDQVHESFHLTKNTVKLKLPKFEPLLLSSTNASLTKDGFLSSSGFQETKRVLTKAAIEGASDWLRGLKECIIVGRIIPAGSAFLNYKNYLDNIYLFKHYKEQKIYE